MHLSQRFASNSTRIMGSTPLHDDVIRQVAPSIYAEHPHESRSRRYAYIPTVAVLDALRKHDFAPFFACQAKSRIEGKTEYTKHMLRLRHRSQVADSSGTASEIILLNSHDGTSSYQMLAGMFRFVCHNGLVCGDVIDDVRIKHSGNVVDSVVDGAFHVLDQFRRVEDHRDEMRTITLHPEEQRAFASAALALRYEDNAPIEPRQVLQPRRFEDAGNDVWSVFNRLQENLTKGGLHGRNANNRRTTTRAVNGIDGNVALNRGLWVLAEAMAQLKTA